MNDWTNELSVKFMDNYQSQPILWDPKLPGHKDKSKTNDAWTKISKELNIPIEELKNKKNSIMATFRGHLRKKKASTRSGVGQNEVYQPIWFLFNQINSFLGTINDCNSTINTEQENNSGINHETEEGENNDSNETTLSNTLNHETLIENQTIRENQTPSKPRRRGTSIELDEAGKQMKRAFSTLENCIKNRKEEDEYDYYAKILATKIRKLPENEREVFMYEVDGLYINCLRRSNNQLSTSRSTTPIFGTNIQSRPPSSLSSYSEPEIIISSYPKNDEYSLSNPSLPAVIQHRTQILGTNSRPPTTRSTTSILGTNGRPPTARSTTPIVGTNIQSRPPSSLSSYSEPEIIISSYPQNDEYSLSNPSLPAVIQHRTQILGTNSRPPTTRSTTSILGINGRPPPARSTTPIVGTNIQSRPPSSLASSSEPEIITSSYPQSDEYSISNPSSPAVIQHKTYSNPQYSNPLYSEQLSIPIHLTNLNQPAMTNSNIISKAFYNANGNEQY